MADGDLLSQLAPRLKGLPYQRRRVAFLLGSDQEISRETRVAMTPRHLAKLKEVLASHGRLETSLWVIAGAGSRAAGPGQEAFTDEQYVEAGAEIVPIDRVATLEDLDLVHALKEPSEYEAQLPGPFLRLGALHLASKPTGVCRLLARRRFAALLDGATAGNCAYAKCGGDRTPIVGSMSRFAGTVAALKLLVGLAEKGHGRGKILIVGGGIAGFSALETIRSQATELIIVERYPRARQRLTRELRNRGYEGFAIIPELTDEALEDAIGIVFAHRSGARKAEKVCHIDQIRRMRGGAAVVDISIDQGGSIDHDDYDENDDVATAQRKYRRLLESFYYYAETNMPREQPREASETHGDASLPYVTLLLALCALHGGPVEATRQLLERPVWSVNRPAQVSGLDLLDCLIQDVRNGIQLAIGDDGAVEIPHPDIAKDLGLAAWIDRCARS